GIHRAVEAGEVISPPDRHAGSAAQGVLSRGGLSPELPGTASGRALYRDQRYAEARRAQRRAAAALLAQELVAASSKSDVGSNSSWRCVASSRKSYSAGQEFTF